MANLSKVQGPARTWLAAAWMALLVACASQNSGQSPATPAAATGKDAAAAPKGAAPAPRKLPRFQFPSNIDWYPAKAKKAHETGRVLVGFSIDGKGKATSLKVLKAEAPRILRSAALNFVTDMAFDVGDPAFNASDPTPFAISVRFCIIDCGTLVGYPGYEDARITGSPISPLDSML
jgi:TonB family protein